MLKVAAKNNNLNLETLMNNEKKDSTEEINNMATFLAIKMAHIFKDISKGEYYIDQVCAKAKEMYVDNITHNTGEFLIQDVQL